MVRLFTPEGGSLSAVAYRARQSRSRFPGGLDGITLVDAALTERSPGFLTITGAQVRELYWHAKTDFPRTSAASLVCELLMKTQAHGGEALRLFSLALSLLEALNRADGPAAERVALAGAVLIARGLSFLPASCQCVRCEGPGARAGALPHGAPGGSSSSTRVLHLESGEVTCHAHAGSGGGVRLGAGEAALLARVLAEGLDFLRTEPPVEECRALLVRLAPFLERLVNGPVKSLAFL